MDLGDRLAGAVLGHLVGDAVGVPYEFRPPVPAGEVRFGAAGTHRQPPGTWSDDGALMLAQLDSLLTAGFDPADFGRRALDWHRRGAYTPDGDGLFDIGNATRDALARLEAGTPAEQAGGTDGRSCGNGSLMRILPLAIVERDLGDAELVAHAHRLSAVTHGHSRPKVASALYVLIARSLLSGVGREDALAWARGRLRAIYAADLAASDLAALDHLEAWSERAGRGRVWDSFWSAWDAFAGAGSYRETVERAVAYGEDTDTTAAIAGGLAGIRFGLGGIPADWLAGLRGREVVGPLVERLIATTGHRTSADHPIRVDWLDPADAPLFGSAFGGRLGMTFLPGKRASGLAGEHRRDLAADLDRLRDVHRADVLLVLVEDAELERFGVAALPDAAAARGLELLRHPIRDGGIPADAAALRRTLDAVLARLRVGASVVVACRGGLGRTGLVVACLVRELGEPNAERAIEVTRAARPGAVETDEQRAFIAAWTWPGRDPAFDRPLVARLAELGELVPVLESAAEADFGTWSTPRPAGDVSYLPQLTFGPVGEAFLAAVGRGGWVFPFDWGAWLQTAEGRALQEGGAADAGGAADEGDSAVAGATPLQLARLLTAIVRSDRFTEGSIAGAFGSGLLLAIARRARVLADAAAPGFDAIT